MQVPKELTAVGPGRVSGSAQVHFGVWQWPNSGDWVNHILMLHDVCLRVDVLSRNVRLESGYEDLLEAGISEEGRISSRAEDRFKPMTFQFSRLTMMADSEPHSPTCTPYY